MGLFDIDRFKESNALCRLDEGRERDGLIHRLYNKIWLALSPPSGWRSQGGRRLTVRTTKERLGYRLGSLTTGRHEGTNSDAFAAVHESGSGTFETCRRALKMSVEQGRPEVIG
jgi:hypothetical protein